MSHYAKYYEFQKVRLKHSKQSVSDHPITQLDVPRPVTTVDHGVIIDVHDVEGPGYEVEFFEAHGIIVDILTVHEDEIEPYE